MVTRMVHYPWWSLAGSQHKLDSCKNQYCKLVKRYKTALSSEFDQAKNDTDLCLLD